MSLATLPLIIIENILSYLVLQLDYPSRDWKYNLVLLSICSEWRKVALPLVYSFMYINSGDELGSGFNSKDDGIYSTASSGFTNIGLIKSLGYTELVRRIKISIEFNHYFESLVNGYEVIFGFSLYNWTKVSRLEVVINEQSENNNINNDYKYRIQCFTNRIKAAMPYINSMGFSTAGVHSKSMLLCKNIFAMYSTQIRVLDCDEMSIINLNDTLYKLNIDDTCTLMDNSTLDTDENYVKLTSADILRNPSVNSIRCSSTFPSRGNNEIHFKQLKKFTLFVNASEWQTQISNIQAAYSGLIANPTVFVFPVLETLELSLQYTDQLLSFLCSDRYSFTSVKTLIIYFRPKEEDLEFNYYSEYSAISVVENIKARMPNIQTLQLHCIMLDNSDIDLVKCLANSYHNCITEFVILHSFSIVPFACNRLMRLTVDAALGCLIDFVKLNAPTLQILTLNNVPYDFSWSSISNAGINGSIIFPCLQILRVIFNFRCRLETDLELFVKHSQQLQHRYSNIISDISTIFPRLETLAISRTSYYAFQNMISNIGMLSNATSLKIDYSTILNGISGCKTFNSSKLNAALKQLGDTILHALPNIRKLEYSTNVRTKYSDICFNTLNKGYCSQLCTISSDTYLETNYLPYSDHLEKVTLQTSNLNTHFQLSLHSQTLRSFAIVDNSGRFSWTWFKPVNKYGDIRLDHLKKLFVRICENSRTNIRFLLNTQQESEAPQRVFMPNVDCIDFEVFNRYTSLPLTEIYFKTVKSVNLIGPVCALPIQGDNNSNILNGLEVTVTNANAEDMDQFYCLTNSWFGGKISIGPSELKLEKMNFDIEPNRILWTNVKRLTINCPVRITTLFCLLPRMPNLINLIISQSYVDGLPDCIEKFEYSDQDQPTFELLSATVESISISNLNMCGNHDEGISSITHLILANPSLKLFKIKGLKTEKAKLIKKYRTKYPHINNIIFR